MVKNQSNEEIKKLLQIKIFNHSTVKKYNSYSQSVLSKLSKCHTSQIGYHVMKCDNRSCNHSYYQYHSCGDRHCPNCGGMKREEWIEDRMNELLPTKYYHIVFTVPHELHSLFLCNRKKMYDLIFESGHYTILKLGKDVMWLGGTPGIISILHTNGQDLSFHPHIHCIVSGGGINGEGKWIKEKRSSGKFLYPRRVMEMMYKARFMKLLQKMLGNGDINIPINYDLQILKEVGYKKWNVYAKAPFGGPAQIIEYLGRYTHKVAITSHRITEIKEDKITFRYKEYKDGSKQKMMTLTHEEFIRRYELHILPKRYVKIRHAGFMSHQGKNERIAEVSRQLKLPPPKPKVKVPMEIKMLIKTGEDISKCKKCNEGKYQLIDTMIMWNGSHVSVHELRNKGKPKNENAMKN